MELSSLRPVSSRKRADARFFPQNTLLPVLVKLYIALGIDKNNLDYQPIENPRDLPMTDPEIARATIRADVDAVSPVITSEPAISKGLDYRERY
jgi:hypothetical protein